MAHPGRRRIEARLGEPLTKDLTNQALRTALDPQNSWMPSVLEAADRRLSEVRRHVPDAGGLVIATDQDSARAYAKLLKQISGEAATVVLSDEKLASSASASSARTTSAGWSPSGWCPRGSTSRASRSASRDHDLDAAVLRPGGRPLRACRTRGEIRIGLPCRRCLLLGFASEMEVQRDHVLGRRINDEGDIFAAENDLLAQANATEASDGGLALLRGASAWRPASTASCTTGASSATRRGAMWGRRRRWTSRHPGAARARPDARAAPPPAEPSSARKQKAAAAWPADTVAEVSTHEQLAILRRELNGPGRRLAPPHRPGARHHPRGAAQGVRRTRRRWPTAEQLHARIDRIREWAVRRSS